MTQVNKPEVMFTETGFLLCGLHAELILHVLLNTARQWLNELKLKNDFHTYVNHT